MMWLYLMHTQLRSYSSYHFLFSRVLAWQQTWFSHNWCTLMNNKAKPATPVAWIHTFCADSSQRSSKKLWRHRSRVGNLRGWGKIKKIKKSFLLAWSSTMVFLQVHRNIHRQNNNLIHEWKRYLRLMSVLFSVAVNHLGKRRSGLNHCHKAQETESVSLC